MGIVVIMEHVTLINTRTHIVCGVCVCVCVIAFYMIITGCWMDTDGIPHANYMCVHVVYSHMISTCWHVWSEQACVCVFITSLLLDYMQ